MIASGLSPFTPEGAAVKAGKLMLEEIERYRRLKADFAFETTLAGRTYLRLLKDIKSEGYYIRLFFLRLQSSDLALQRVKERVTMGGHNVPVQTILRRFDRGLYNLFHLYRPLFDSWIMFDNSGKEPIVIAEETNGRITVLDKQLFPRVERN